MNFYCISCLTGFEEKYREKVQKKLDEPCAVVKGKVHFLKKQMRLKNGKEYYEAFFAGYVFLETEETKSAALLEVASEKEFLRFLPANNEILPLCDKDKNIILSILQYGSVVGIVPVTFDENDKIVICDGVFKGLSGHVVAVNRRNKRVNVVLDFMNNAKVVGLTYEEIRKK